MSWRHILRQYGPDFRSWLYSNQHRYKCFDELANQLENFLKIILKDEDTCRTFWGMIPDVLAQCNENSIFERPLAVEAYAYVHLLERYRRFWDVLLLLTENAILPLGDYGINVLDIGTGPAPALYAVDDYYRLLSEFADTQEIEELQLPRPQLDCIELSQEMIRFCHHFAEYSNRFGPFRATFPDFHGVDFPQIRQWERYRLAREGYDDPSTGEFEFDSTEAEAHDYAVALFRYRMVILSNFLTLGDTVDTFQNEILSLFRDVNPGAVVVIVGAYGSPYPDIYAKVEIMAQRSGIRHIQWVDEILGEQSWPQFAKRMKQFHYAIFEHITRFCDSNTLPREAYLDYWCPIPSTRYHPKFGLRVFRKGK
ncbi:MAG: hypothetical protein A2Y73_01845 [Chloroflexi bacterium RBG_13_56_8]|nr:MAG: hypothetical protein A2Y73_01845 [Chloroflexi bacterium RBG_13_56_8]